MSNPVSDVQVMIAAEGSQTPRQLTNVLKIFYSPEEVFRYSAVKAGWVLPLAFSALLASLLVVVVTNSVDTKAMLRKQLASRPELVQQLGQDKIDEIVQQSESPGRRLTSYIVAAVAPPIVIGAIAGLLTGMLLLFGARPEFRRVLFVTAYSYYVYYAVTLVLSSLLLFLTKDKSEIDLNNLVKANLGAFLDKASHSKVLLSLASSLDVFTLGLLFLIGFGLSKAITRLSFGKAITAVGCLWLVYVAAKAGLSGVF
jgi:hypothetical protein